ncbi:MAG: prephenate dehydrogenase/arogenate dehydrogenase family protein [Candidatus Obscuribacterales bacterium]|nr:prephenate dehydrogenase/arogenate dehydrogenase family protein [Candidatus Obscuribacterales bacterium]
MSSVNNTANTARWQSNLSIAQAEVETGADTIAVPQICELRHKIDRIDSDIAKLLVERFSAAQKIGNLKAEAKLPVLDNLREKEVLQRAIDAADDPASKQALETIFTVIMEQSRKIQAQIKNEKNKSLAFPEVLVIGVGLIGGSLIRQINTMLPDTRIFGCDEAVKLLSVFEAGFIEKGDSNFTNLLHEASLVVLASSPKTNLKLLKQIAPFLKRGQVVMDVTSTKSSICKLAEQLDLNEAEFIGGHPFMGSEKQGFEASSEVKVDGSVFCLTPTAKSSEVSIGRVLRWLGDLNFRVEVMDAKSHDAVAARISHLVQLIAVALGSSMKESLSEEELAAISGISGKTFRELRRLMNSPSAMWSEIVQQNGSEIIQSLSDLRAKLLEIEGAIESGDQLKLAEHFENAAEIPQA